MKLSKKPHHLVKPRGGLKSDKMQGIEGEMLGVYLSK